MTDVTKAAPQIGSHSLDRGGASWSLPTVSVVICAYTEDRWNDLVAACASVNAELGAGDQLLLIIDHNDRLLGRARSSLTGLTILPSEGPRGLSAARNTGIDACRGDVVAFLDDDAVIRPGWLESIRILFVDAAVGVVGTGVEPRWQGDRAPRWFPDEFGWVVGCGYTGQPTEKAAIRNPIGASMAVRRSAFGAVGGFSHLVGRVGTLPVGCEETEFCIRLAQTLPDTVVLFEPQAAVDHFVPWQRQTLRYFLRRCFHEGRSKSAVARLSGRDSALSSERAYVRDVLPAAMARGVSPRHLRRDPAAALKAAVVFAGLSATVAGFVAGSLKRSSESLLPS